MVLLPVFVIVLIVSGFVAQQDPLFYCNGRNEKEQISDILIYMFRSLLYITGNLDKAKQTALYCHIPFQHKDIDLPEIQSLDPKEIIKQKVKEAYKIVKSPVLVEDVSLTFLALGKLPDTLIRWFLEELGADGLCRLLDGYMDRSAVAQVTYGFYDGKTVKFFAGKTRGTIAEKPSGNSFGWNNIFIPEGHTKTWGEMSEEEKSPTYMRRIALEKLEQYLKKM